MNKPQTLTKSQIDLMQLDVLLTLAEAKFNDIQSDDSKYLNPTLSKELLKSQKLVTNICDRLFSKFDLRTADMINARLRGMDEVIQVLFSVSDATKNKIIEFAIVQFEDELKQYENGK